MVSFKKKNGFIELGLPKTCQRCLLFQLHKYRIYNTLDALNANFL